MNKFEKRIIFISLTTHALAHFFEQTFPPVLKLVDAEYGLGLTGAGGIGNIFPFFFGLGALPAGMIVDRWGARRTLLLYLVVCAIGAVGTLFINGLWLFAVLLALMGMAAGLCHPAGTSIISHNVKQVGAGLGYHGMGGNFGLAITPIIAATIAAKFGWRAAYAWLAVPSILMALYLYADKNIKDEDGLDATSNGGKQNGVAETSWLPLSILMLVSMANGFFYRGMLTFLPTYFSSASTDKIDILKGGGFTTAVLFLGVVGQLFGGKMADKYRGQIVYAISFTIVIPLIATLGLLSPSVALPFAGLFMLIYFANQPVGNVLVAQLSSSKHRGRAYGIFFFMNFGLGSFAATATGYVGDQFGLDAIFPFLGATLVIVSLLSWVLVAIMKKNPEPQIRTV